jgi:hypothetical protein
MLGGPGAAGAFARAISADPDFALAHIVRSRVHSFYQQGDAARKQAGIASEKISRHVQTAPCGWQARRSSPCDLRWCTAAGARAQIDSQPVVPSSLNRGPCDR